MFHTDVGKLTYCILNRNIPVIGFVFFFLFFFLSLGCAISRHGGDVRLVFSVTVHWKVQQHMGFLSPLRADSNRQIPRRIQCQRRVISIGVALWLMSFQCVFQWQCSYTALIAIPRLRQRGQVAKAEEHSGRQNAKSGAHVHVTSPGDPPNSSSEAPPGSYLKKMPTGGLTMTLINDERVRSVHRHEKRKNTEKTWAQLRQRGWEAGVE